MLSPGEITFSVMARAETNEAGRPHLGRDRASRARRTSAHYGYISEHHCFGMTRNRDRRLCGGSLAAHHARLDAGHGDQSGCGLGRAQARLSNERPHRRQPFDHGGDRRRAPPACGPARSPPRCSCSRFRPRKRHRTVPATYAVPPSFLGVARHDRDAPICIAGIPLDLGTTNRSGGARFGPAAIRQASRMLTDGDASAALDRPRRPAGGGHRRFHHRAR